MGVNEEIEMAVEIHRILKHLRVIKSITELTEAIDALSPEISIKTFFALLLSL